MKKLCKTLLKIFLVLAKVVGILFIVYFWNLDQKLLTGVYRLVNNVFDRKKADIKF
ncbi:hypothetical protein [Guggenheimella bovis]